MSVRDAIAASVEYHQNNPALSVGCHSNPTIQRHTPPMLIHHVTVGRASTIFVAFPSGAVRNVELNTIQATVQPISANYLGASWISTVSGLATYSFGSPWC